MKVIEVLHNPMTWESEAKTHSIHKTKKGASQAMAHLKSKIWQDPFYRESWMWFGYRITELKR